MLPLDLGLAAQRVTSSTGAKSARGRSSMVMAFNLRPFFRGKCGQPSLQSLWLAEVHCMTTRCLSAARQY